MFEGLQTDAAQMTMAPGPVVEDYNVIEDIAPSQRAGVGDPFSDTLLF